MSGPPPDPRRNYDRDTLDEARAAGEPFAQFGAWFADALAANLIEPHAMVLATAGELAHPSARAVLLRGWDERGFVFFTNYNSRKGREIAADPFAALLFYWDALERQVRIEGPLSAVSAEESDAYFARRPRGHQLAAWASEQSEIVSGRAELERAVERAEERFAGIDVPRPPHWGGYRVRPQRIEFWQGRPNRMHDRLRYERTGGGWTRVRLAP